MSRNLRSIADRTVVLCGSAMSHMALAQDTAEPAEADGLRNPYGHVISAEFANRDAVPAANQDL